VLADRGRKDGVLRTHSGGKQGRNDELSVRAKPQEKVVAGHERREQGRVTEGRGVEKGGT